MQEHGIDVIRGDRTGPVIGGRRTHLAWVGGDNREATEREYRKLRKELTDRGAGIIDSHLMIDSDESPKVSGWIAYEEAGDDQ